jgi:phosphate transport system substrate-binding protein
VRTRKGFAFVVGAVALTLVAAACGGDDSGSSSDTTAAAETTAAATTAGGSDTTASADTTAAGGGGTEIDYASLSGTLDGSGATFPKAFYEEMIAAFGEVAPDVTVNYAGGGSGKGRQDLADQITVWAGSDSTVKEEDIAKFKGGEFLYFPTVVAPITVSYNLDGVDELNLNCQVIAGIFQGTITNWNDPAIAALNDGVTLPDLKVTPAVRSDSSGTTSNFSKYLDNACGSKGDGTWTLKSDSTIEWPQGVSAGNGNAGVAQIVSSTPGAIGYVDLSDAVASDLTTALIENKAGEFIAPTLEGASAAAEGAEIKDDLTFSAVWADGAEAYPITAQTWIIVYKNQTDAEVGKAIQGFLNFILTEGQDIAPEVDFAPLPAGLDEQAIAQLDEIVIP